MINSIIADALENHDFKLESANDVTSFYKRESEESIRFAILHKLEKILTVTELNSLISKAIPESFRQHPAFKKNCDLICVFNIDKLSRFKDFEERIFEIEEDPHYFKKYILYYSNEEAELWKTANYEEMVKTISNKKLFEKYKKNPLLASRYSLAARIFIKLPFLELPFTRGQLVPVKARVEQAIQNEDLKFEYSKISHFDLSNIDQVILELIDNELENI